mmetsp:Transcript_53277/g.159514  ORF Transcript_53277/g.159514 Transcript_53277/m.159514 type:complete len:264 (-) Transcript_53277:1125-1916(-)
MKGGERTNTWRSTTTPRGRGNLPSPPKRISSTSRVPLRRSSRGVSRAADLPATLSRTCRGRDAARRRIPSRWEATPRWQEESGAPPSPAEAVVEDEEEDEGEEEDEEEGGRGAGPPTPEVPGGCGRVSRAALRGRGDRRSPGQSPRGPGGSRGGRSRADRPGNKEGGPLKRAALRGRGVARNPASAPGAPGDPAAPPSVNRRGMVPVAEDVLAQADKEEARSPASSTKRQRRIHSFRTWIRLASGDRPCPSMRSCASLRSSSW